MEIDLSEYNNKPFCNWFNQWKHPGVNDLKQKNPQILSAKYHTGNTYATQRENVEGLIQDLKCSLQINITWNEWKFTAVGRFQ